MSALLAPRATRPAGSAAEFASRRLGLRAVRDRVMACLVAAAFALALVPLVSLLWTVVARGLARFDADFFTHSMRNVVDAGGGGLHALVGTLEITGLTALVSVPIGLLAAVYLVEYGRGRFAAALGFLVDVMTGIPSIVAGLFAYALVVFATGEAGLRNGLMGAIALSVLMVPVVVRTGVEVLRLVPDHVREGALALGAPKWRTVVRVAIPTALAGLVTGSLHAVARIVGETAPLLLVAGYTASMNYNPAEGRMMTLPVFVYTQYANHGPDAAPFLDRAWAGALTLVAIVVAVNLLGRLLARILSPRPER